MNDNFGTSVRFATLLQGSNTTAEIYDRPLLERQDWLVAPTLGAIVPNWVLVIPRMRALNFREWQRKTGKKPELIVSAVCQHLGLRHADVIWFEHGPTERGSVSGCGVDYAHLHILFNPHFTFEALTDQARSMSKLDWQLTVTSQAYDFLSEADSYFVAGSGEQAISALNVESAGSQFFRRVIGSLTGRNELWDYRCHRHSDNITTTIKNFQILEGVTECDR